MQKIYAPYNFKPHRTIKHSFIKQIAQKRNHSTL